MDPKALGNLDPKLKETYERVMGAAPGAATPAQTTPQATPAAPNTTPAPQPATGANVPSYTADNLKFQAAIQQAPAAGNTTVTPITGVIPTPQHQTPPLLSALYIIGAIVFFVVYAYFWAKIFNLPLPF